MDRNTKTRIVKELTASFRDTPTMFVSEFSGLDVPKITELRDSIRESDATFTVVKNTLARRAAADAGRDDLVEHFHGTTAVAFVKGDAASVAKALTTFSKANKDTLVFRGGIMDDAVVDATQISEIAELPPREVVLAMLVGAVNAPMVQAVGAINAPMRDMVQVLDAVIEKRKAEEGEG